VALEGHDGSGKTTLAKRLAARLDAAYVRPYGGPRGGEMLAAAERGDHQRALDLAQSLAGEAIDAADGPRLVCDRLWLTVFTIVPEAMFEQWGDRAPTAVCWADAATTLERLGERSEPSRPSAWHEHYLSRYRELARQFDCPLVRTDGLSEEQALDALTDWVQGS
jgi:hypothetical protein